MREINVNNWVDSTFFIYYIIHCMEIFVGSFNKLCGLTQSICFDILISLTYQSVFIPYIKPTNIEVLV